MRKIAALLVGLTLQMAAQTASVDQHVIAEEYASLELHFPMVPTAANRTQYLHRYDAMKAYADAETELALRLFRYADIDALPQVLPAFKARLAERNCEAQDNVLAYLLKVKSGEADALLRLAASNRAAGHTGCAGSMFEQIGKLIRDPVLETFAIDSLNDQDPTVAIQAVFYLRDHGSDKAEQPLFDWLVEWYVEQRGHEPDKSKEFDLMGTQLVQALVLGRGWLVDKARMDQIRSLVPEPNDTLNLAVQSADVRPIQVYFMGRPPAMFSVAQYQLESVDELHAKLSQYPKGTAFAWNDQSFGIGGSSDQVSHDLALWSAASGVRIEGLNKAQH